MTRILRKHGKWLLATISTIIGLLACELVIRLADLAPPVHAIWMEDAGSFYQRSTNPILNYEIKPDFKRETEVGTATSNSHGLRDKPRKTAKPNGVKRIVLLGDSVVEGVNYVPDGQTINRELEALYPDGSIECLNFGTSGYCTLSEVTLLKEKGLPFAPDLVVLLFVYNDYNNFNPEHTVAGGVRERPEWSKHLFVGSELFRYASLKLNWFHFAEEKSPEGRHHDAIGGNNVVDGLRRLRQLANEHKFDVMIVPWPSFTDEYVGYRRHTESGPLLIERLARLNGFPIELLDTRFNALLEQMQPRPSPRTHFTVRQDRMHPNANGTKAAAKMLKDLIDAGRAKYPYEPGPDDAEAVRIAEAASATPAPPLNPDQRIVNSLLYQVRIEDAVKHMRELLKRDPGHVSANLFIGEHLMGEQKPDEAVPFLLTALQSNPENIRARTKLAESLNHVGRVDEAEGALLTGLQSTPDSPELHLTLGAICVTNSNPPEAKRHLGFARQLGADSVKLKKLQDQLMKSKSQPN